jgi:ABC-type dipeptide/oligopeptide/nickel transport system permease subunit
VVGIWWYATGVSHSLKPDAQTAQRFQFVWQLYNGSHSLLVFGAVLGLVWGWFGVRCGSFWGWGLHILIDIPTHTGIFAIHFLGPLSSYRFEGIRWENPWFMAVNYGALLAVFGWMWRARRARDAATDRDARPVAKASR